MHFLRYPRPRLPPHWKTMMMLLQAQDCEDAPTFHTAAEFVAIEYRHMVRVQAQ